MTVAIPGGWTTFVLLTSGALLLLFVMQLLAKYFISLDVVPKRFSILDMQLAASELEIDNLLTGIGKLRPGHEKKVIANLRYHLFIDFLFMPLAYGAIFIGCMLLSVKATGFNQIVFAVLGWAQIIPWICDIVENTFLLRKISKHNGQKNLHATNYKGIQNLIAAKWVISLAGITFIFSAFMYYWVSGMYEHASLKIPLFLFIAVMLYFIIGRLTKNIATNFIANAI